MKILHKVKPEELYKVVSQPIADMIIKGRQGELNIVHGGGGVYGKVLD